VTAPTVLVRVVTPNKQLLLAARGIVVAARALRARAAFCCDAPQQNCGRYTAATL